MSEQSDRVKVRVIASQRVRYDQTLSLSKEEWESLKRMDEIDAADMILDLLDLRNVWDADELDDGFEAFVVDENGKTTGDSY